MTEIYQQIAVCAPWWFGYYIFVSMLAFVAFVARAKFGAKEEDKWDYLLSLIALPEMLVFGFFIWIHDQLDLRKFDREMKKFKAADQEKMEAKEHV